ncbi:hypothetical protein LCGC14_0547960 [marine sediment metagenome]|uniref:Uncharacterized protein n=1 Tax=marine sediment metagenome TaxID=412755 RepID=A0A0F9RVP5_9ZZZZ
MKKKDKYIIMKWNSKAQTKEFWKEWSKLTRIPLKFIRGPKYSLLHAWLESF